MCVICLHLRRKGWCHCHLSPHPCLPKVNQRPEQVLQKCLRGVGKRKERTEGKGRAREGREEEGRTDGRQAEASSTNIYASTELCSKAIHQQSLLGTITFMVETPGVGGWESRGKDSDVK